MGNSTDDMPGNAEDDLWWRMESELAREPPRVPKADKCLGGV